MNNNILRTIAEYLIKESDMELEVEDLTRETKLQEDLGLDSLQAVTLIMDMEDKFNISVDDDEVEGLTTIGEFVDLIINKKKE
ncbi:acyl carrier protein [Desulfobacula sp.]|uniref:acyl carrier protein n=1 Tax=Desulfobacula sp. TaxID=2593537 RepID=UPI002622A77A|nr:acyl carrier protein [Desulfobacula sp.]